MSDDIAKERHDMLVERIYDLKESVGKDIAEIKESVKETCAALRDHSKIDDDRYQEQQKTAQKVDTATKVLKVGTGVVGTIGVREIWNFFKH